MSTPTFFQSKNRATLIIFFISWIIIQTWTLAGYGLNYPTALIDSVISNILLAGSCFLISHVLRFYLPENNQLLFLFGLVLLVNLVWFLLARFTLQTIFSGEEDYLTILKDSDTIRFAISFLIGSCVALISVITKNIREQRSQEGRFQEIEKLARDAELYRLRQQLQPHFLFNSLNSINALVTSQPDRARTMIQQLSEFLRGTIRKEENNLIALKDEMRHLELYLDIEKVRFGHRLHTHTIIPEEVAKLKIPGLLLQPLVENAIKYGVYHTSGEVEIRIEAGVKDRLLEIKIQNPYDPNTPSNEKGTGFGLRSVNRRLDLIFGRNDLVKTEGKDQIFTTIVKIPQYDQSPGN